MNMLAEYSAIALNTQPRPVWFPSFLGVARKLVYEMATQIVEHEGRT
jgi:hypothetical protein